MPLLDRLVDHAIAYYRDFVRPRETATAIPTDIERAALADLAETLPGMTADADAETIQNVVFEVGKRHPFPNCAPGSAACIRCCWASRKARASAASSRCTASTRRSR